MPPEQFDDGERRQPDFEPGKRTAHIEVRHSDLCVPIQERETRKCIPRGRGDHKYHTSFVNWQSAVESAMPESPAPIYSKLTTRETGATALSF